MYNRKTYFARLSQWKDKPLIKIITGLRRSGKSTLIKLFIDTLRNSGIGSERILYINKESLQFQYIATFEDCLFIGFRRNHSKGIQSAE